MGPHHHPDDPHPDRGHGPMIGYEPGWLGGFTRNQAPGAHPNGSRVVKVREEDGDSTPLGTGGTVLGSLDGSALGYRNPDGSVVRFAYFVEWEDKPRVAVGVLDWKIDRQA